MKSTKAPQQLANAIRFLKMDAVLQANSGHPGMPMGMADIAEVLWNGYLKHNPSNPNWADRDRIVRSNGHGSMSCAERFEQQDQTYREQVLPQGVRARVAVEAGVTDCWKKYTGLDGAIIGIDRFGESAPAEDLYQHFGITVEAIVESAQSLCEMTVTEAA